MLEAVLWGEYLKVRLFQSVVLKDGVGSFRMDCFAKVFAYDGTSFLICQDAVSAEVFCQTQIDGQSGFFNEETGNEHIQFEQSFRSAVHQVE